MAKPLAKHFSKPFALTSRQPKLNAFENTFRFQCRARKLPPFEEQFQFAKCVGRKFASDFAFVEYKILVEINGGIFTPGAGHSSGVGLQRDYEKMNLALDLGFLPYTYTTAQVTNGEAVEAVMQSLYKHGWRS